MSTSVFEEVPHRATPGPFADMILRWILTQWQGGSLFGYMVVPLLQSWKITGWSLKWTFVITLVCVPLSSSRPIIISRSPLVVKTAFLREDFFMEIRSTLLHPTGKANRLSFTLTGMKFIPLYLGLITYIWGISLPRHKISFQRCVPFLTTGGGLAYILLEISAAR